MKYPVITLMVAMALALGGCDRPGDGGTETTGMLLPTATGTTLEWASLRGDWVLVNYWAEWCKPCLEEIPELNELDALDQVTVLAVNFDGVEGEALRELGSKMGIEFTMLARDPVEDFGWNMPSALPTTFLVNPDGELEATLLGAQTEDQLRQRMGL